jgi:hypothetical protein
MENFDSCDEHCFKKYIYIIVCFKTLILNQIQFQFQP